MSIYGTSFDRAQSAYDRAEPAEHFERELCAWCETFTAVQHPHCEQMIAEHTCSACGRWFFDYKKGDVCECGKGRLGE